MPRDFTITAISSSNEQFNKLNGAPLVPVILTTPGPLSLKLQTEPYKVVKGDKEI